jgi:hypothetical protein
MQADDPGRLLPWDPAAATLLALLPTLPVAGFRFEAQTQPRSCNHRLVNHGVSAGGEAGPPCLTAAARLGLLAVLRIERTSRQHSQTLGIMPSSIS